MATLIMTAEEAAKDRQKWLELRNKGIGGSDIAAILGVSKWKSTFALWQEKTGAVKPEDLTANEYVYWGTVLEDAVANRFCELTGKKVRRRGMLADDEHPYMLANIDREVVGEEAGLECKTANGFSAKLWDGDEVPDQYYLQCQWYMMVTGFPKWYIAVLIGGNHFVWKEITRCEEQIKIMREAAIDFWAKVQSGEMPALDGSKDCADAILKKYPSAEKKKEITLGGEAETIAGEYLELKTLADEMKKQADKKANELKDLLGDAEIGWAGEHKVTWSNRAGSTTIDGKRLKAERPEIYAEYARTGSPTRTFKVA